MGWVLLKFGKKGWREGFGEDLRQWLSTVVQFRGFYFYCRFDRIYCVWTLACCKQSWIVIKSSCIVAVHSQTLRLNFRKNFEVSSAQHKVCEATNEREILISQIWIRFPLNFPPTKACHTSKLWFTSAYPFHGDKSQFYGNVVASSQGRFPFVITSPSFFPRSSLSLLFLNLKNSSVHSDTIKNWQK
jgi:hypothetical protein